MSILVVGSVALDTIQTPLGSCDDALGGSATYFSLSASFFGPVNLVGVVGTDFPHHCFDIFKRKGISLEGLQVKEGKTFRWVGEYGWDFSDPRTIATHLNVFSQFDPCIPAAYTKSRYVFLANIDPQIQAKVLGQVRKPKLIICDTMDYWIENKREHLLKLLKKVDMFLLNETEARMLTHEANVVRAAQALIKLGPATVVIKKGEHGALLFMKKSVFCVPAFLLESIFDPTGAGDTFAGGFVGYLSRCKTINQANLKRAVVYGSVMATFAVEDFSIRRLVSLRKPEVTKRVREFKKLTDF
ncbi:MAG: sugar kinase [Candidatus Omnitrophota bacterium]|nr:MAG: sugar kinase [Candidatus Omnitrophota bacterium]